MNSERLKMRHLKEALYIFDIEGARSNEELSKLLERESKFYDSQEEKLISEHPGQYIALKEEKFLGFEQKFYDLFKKYYKTELLPVLITQISSSLDIDSDEKEDLEEKLMNFSKFVIPKILNINNSGEAYCEVEIYGQTKNIKFPPEVISGLNLRVNDTFIWYPQEKNNILPEDCHLKPIHRIGRIKKRVIDKSFKRAFEWTGKSLAMHFKVENREAKTLEFEIASHLTPDKKMKEFSREDQIGYELTDLKGVADNIANSLRIVLSRDPNKAYAVEIKIIDSRKVLYSEYGTSKDEFYSNTKIDS